MEPDTSTDVNDLPRGRAMKSGSTAKAAGAIVIGAVVLLALIRAGFRGRSY